MNTTTMFRFAVVLVALAFASGCAEPEYEPSFGSVLEAHYGDGVPPEQQVMLDDQVVEGTEIADAATARDACVANIDGVVWVEKFKWLSDIDFAGGEYRLADGVDEAETQPLAEACYFRYLALVETAWVDQEIFGDWTGVSEVDG